MFNRVVLLTPAGLFFQINILTEHKGLPEADFFASPRGKLILRLHL